MIRCASAAAEKTQNPIAKTQDARPIRHRLLSQRTGITRAATERLLARSVERGLVRGLFDGASDAFVLLEAVGRQVFVERCPQCGGQVQRWCFPEERIACPYCNQPVAVPAT